MLLLSEYMLLQQNGLQEDIIKIPVIVFIAETLSTQKYIHYGEEKHSNWSDFISEYIKLLIYRRKLSENARIYFIKKKKKKKKKFHPQHF